MRVTGTVTDDRRTYPRKEPRRCRRCGTMMRSHKPAQMYCSASCRRIQATWRWLWKVDNAYLDNLQTVRLVKK